MLLPDLPSLMSVLVVQLMIGPAGAGEAGVSLAPTAPLLQSVQSGSVSIRECTIQSTDGVRLPTLQRGLLSVVCVRVRQSGPGHSGPLSFRVDLPESASGIRYLSGSQMFPIGDISADRDTCLMFDVLVPSDYSRNAVEMHMHIADPSLRTLDERSEILPVMEKGEWYRRKGSAYFRAGDLPRAVQYLDSSSSVGPSDSVFFLLGLDWEAIGNRDIAITSMRRAMELGNSRAAGWLSEADHGWPTCSVKYLPDSIDIFAGEAFPVVVALLPFTDGYGKPTTFAEKIARAVHGTPGMEKKITLVTVAASSGRNQPHRSPESDQQRAQTLNELKNRKGVKLAISGSVMDEAGSVFTIHVIRAKDMKTVTTISFRTTLRSTGLRDFCNYILAGDVPLYSIERSGVPPR